MREKLRTQRLRPIWEVWNTRRGTDMVKSLQKKTGLEILDGIS
jgi:hypothetical protein